MNSIITVKNISKKYNITSQQGGYVALRDVLTNVAKKPFSFLKQKTKKVIGKAGTEEFWALKDINFEVGKGEAVGIIGANGAGKSTLLKILTEITPPTTGEIEMNGRVASLLEVGTGFHPELTGRENIFLNGAILGMTKKEISAKFNNIVEFAGINKFIDTPVKRYSSGMYVRLAFSVAAHMEPDILLVDEVLAVGDAEFQKKCLGKMDEVTSQGGRTILFVSHNMSAIQNLCKRCILLKDGRVEIIGETKDVIDKYLNTTSKSNKAIFEYPENKEKKVEINKISILNHENKPTNQLDADKKFNIKVEYTVKEDLIKNNYVCVTIYGTSNETILETFDIDNDHNNYLHINRKKGRYISNFNVPANLFNQKTYTISVIAGIPLNYNNNLNNINYLDIKKNINIFFLKTSKFAKRSFKGTRSGEFLLKIPCVIIKKYS